MGVARAEPRQRRRSEAEESRERFPPKTGKAQVVPNDVWLETVNRANQRQGITEAIETPTSDYGESRNFFSRFRQIISKHCQLQPRVLPELISDVEPVLV
jgi:hypothetical protein